MVFGIPRRKDTSFKNPSKEMKFWIPEKSHPKTTFFSNTKICHFGGQIKIPFTETYVQLKWPGGLNWFLQIWIDHLVAYVRSFCVVAVVYPPNSVISVCHVNRAVVIGVKTFSWFHRIVPVSKKSWTWIITKYLGAKMIVCF